MKEYIITTDSSCDTPGERLDNMGIPHISFRYTDGRESFEDRMDKQDNIAFYGRMKTGTVFKTSQINMESYAAFFREVYEKYRVPIIHISLCEALSGSINNARSAADMLSREGILVKVIDSKMASAGLFLLAEKGLECEKKGMKQEDTVKYIETCACEMRTYYVTDDITYFTRGGRLGAITSGICKMLNVNVILDCKPDGGLRVIGKTIGQKNAFKKVCELVGKSVKCPEHQVLYGVNADNELSLKYLTEMLRKEYHFKNTDIHSMGPIIGSHAGPGLIAVFYLGTEKNL